MSEVYKVGVQILLQDNISAGLSAISGKLLGIHKTTKEVEHSLGRWKMAIGGAAGVFLGSGLIRGMAELVGHAKGLSHEIVQIEKLGITAAQMKQVEAAAYKVARTVPGTKEQEPYEIYGAAYSMLGHENALKVMLPLAEFAQVMKNTTGKFDEDATKQLYQMLRSGDLMGKFVNHETHQVDTGKLAHFLDLGSRVMQSTHGFVNAQTWLALAQQGAPALAGMGDRGLSEMAIIAQAMGGHRAGTALTSSFSQFVGGVMTQKTAQALEDIGLLKKGRDYDVRRGGAIVMHQNAADRFSRLISDPLQMLTKTIIPAMEAHGITGIDQQSNYLFRMLGRQTTVRMWSDLLRNRSQIENEVGRMAGGMKIDPARNLANSKDLEQVTHNLTTAWNNMLTSIAAAGEGPAIKVMQAITNVFEKVNQFAHAHPDALQAVGVGLGALAAGVAALGAVALGSAVLGFVGAGGWLVAGIAALGTAVGLAYAIFSGSDFSGVIDRLKKYRDEARESAGGFVDRNLGKGAGDVVRGTLDAVFGAVSRFVTRFSQAGWFGRLMMITSVPQQLGLELVRPLIDVVKTWPGAILGALKRAWDSVQFASWLGGSWDAPKTEFQKAFGRFVDSMKAEIESWPARVASAIASMGSAIVGAIRSHLPSFLGGTPAKPAASPALGKQGLNTVPIMGGPVHKLAMNVVPEVNRPGVVPNVGRARVVPEGEASGAASGRVPGRYNAVPPPRSGEGARTHVDLNVDGRKLAEVTVRHMSDAANGPLQGSAYFDGSATFVPADYAYARG